MKLVPLWVAGSLIAVAAMAGIYAVAATSASGIAATFVTDETAGHTDRIDFAAKAKRISAAYHKVVRAKCDSAASEPPAGAHIPCAS